LPQQIYPYIYPYGYIVGPVMVAFLIISIELILGFPKGRKYILFFLFLGGFFECGYVAYPDGVAIGFLTLTWVGILAVFYFIKAVAIRILASFPFLALGVLLVFPALELWRFVVINFSYNITTWAVMVSWAVTAIGGGIVILVSGLRSRFAAD
jgi:hypothetical protein